MVGEPEADPNGRLAAVRRDALRQRAMSPWAEMPWRGDGTIALRRAGGDRGGEDLAWDYAELAARAGDRARALRTRGLAPGQVVAVQAEPGLDLVLMQHALARAGAALLPVPSGIQAQGLEALLASVSAEWVWTAEGPGPGRLAASGRAGRADPAAALWPSPLALIVPTSGTTGAPRAVMLTAESLSSAAALANARLQLGRDDTWLCCLPLRHIGGLSIPYRCALAGATVLLREGFEAGAVMDDLSRYPVSHLSLVPPMLARLLDLGRPPPPGLRVVLVGGQRLGEPLVRRGLEAGWPLHVTYGMTETASQIATSDRLERCPAPGFAGRPLPGLELDCGDPPGSVPLRVRGPTVMAGYANPGRIPGEGLTDGWLVTSDLGRLGSDGSLWVLGRADEVLVTGGVNVHPARVEDLLLAAPGVDEVVVVGTDDPVWGQRLAALYRGSVGPADLDGWCRVHLSGAERPRSFLRLPELPALPSGKPDRRRLRELAVAATGEADRPT